MTAGKLTKTSIGGHRVVNARGRSCVDFEYLKGKRHRKALGEWKERIRKMEEGERELDDDEDEDTLEDDENWKYYAID